MNFILPVGIITSALTVEQGGNIPLRRHQLPQTSVAWLYSTSHLCTRMPRVHSQYLFSLRPATHFGFRAGFRQARVLFFAFNVAYFFFSLETWCKSLLTVGREGAGGCILSELSASPGTRAPACHLLLLHSAPGLPKPRMIEAKASPCSLRDLCSLCSCDFSMVVPVKTQP